MAIRPIPPPLSDLRLGDCTPLAFFLNDLGAQVQKHFVDVRPPSRAGLVVRFLAPTLGELEGSGTGDHAVVFHVGFVAHDHEGDVLVVFDADDLFAEFGEFVEGVRVADGEDEEETLTLFHVEFAHCGELFCAGCVENF